MAPVGVGRGCRRGTVSAAGCSVDHDPAQPPVPTPLATRPPSARPGVSPSGVTTRVDAPAQSTEDEYFQACHAAKTWMQDRPRDSQALVEAYQAAVQAPHATGVVPGTSRGHC
ncbi:lipoprotein LpqV [Mycobacterium sp.]|uniref:lipoprotein LpqV n=1 Tax=Mycobacterium sp. TaxID=1785 RepID=UPI003BAFEE05